jgi:sugar lactone lactonase YvrE
MLLLSVVWGVCGCDGDPAASDEATYPVPGKLTTAVGTGRQGFDGDGHDARDSWLNQPSELGFDQQGTLYIVDWNNHRLRALADGKLQTIVGSKLPGDWPPDVAADEPLPGTELPLNHPMDIAFADGGRAYLAAWHNHKLLQLEMAAGVVERIAGGDRPGYGGDGGDGGAALLNFPASLVLDASGALLFADQRNNVIRRIEPDASHTVSTIAGVKGPSSYAGDGGPAAEAGLGLCPYDEAGGSDNPPPGGGLALDQDGNLYLADTYNHCVRRISAGSDGLIGSGDPSEELIETVAGDCGSAGFDADPAPAKLLLRTPRDIEVQGGTLYIADSGNHVVTSIALDSGSAERLVGTGEAGDAGEGSEPLAAPLRQPYGIALDDAGNLFIADTLNHRVRVLGRAAK